MSASALLESFDIVAEAADGVELLQGLILDLAVGGHLVQQDPSDEPADALLARIAADQSDRISRGESKPNRAHSPREASKELPPGWCWAYPPDLGFVGAKNSVDPDQVVGFVPMPAVPTDVRRHVQFEERRWAEVSKGYTHVADGDIAIAKITPCFQNGKSAVFSGLPSGVGAATTELFVLRPCPELVNPRYLHLFFRSPAFIANGVPEMTGTAGQQRLPRQYFTDTPIPLPPLEEQDRIVKRANVLLDLCDDLEDRYQRRWLARIRLRDAALHELTIATPSDGSDRAWAFLSTHWQTVMADLDSVEKLRPALLHLATSGRLVESEVAAGSAQEALFDAENQRSRLAAEGAIPAVRPSKPVDEAEVPFDLPDHWMWVRLEQVVTHVVDCLHRTPPYTDAGFPAIRTSDVEPGRVLVETALRVDEETYLEQTRRLVPEAGDVLYSREGGRFGIAAVVPPGVKLCLSQRMMQFRCADAIVPKYLSWFLNSPVGFGQASADVGGSASPHVNIKSIKQFHFPLPPTEEQRRIVDSLGQLLHLTDELARTIGVRDAAAEALALAVSGRPASA